MNSINKSPKLTFLKTNNFDSKAKVVHSVQMQRLTIFNEEQTFQHYVKGQDNLDNNG